MKFSSAFSFVLFACIFSITWASPVASEPQVVRDNVDGSTYSSRGSDAGLILCTGRNFGGTCAYKSPLTSDTCYTNYEPYISNLMSSDTDSEHICLLFTSGSCTDCEACVDVNGWTDMGRFAAVRSYRCLVADSAGCKNTNCRRK